MRPSAFRQGLYQQLAKNCLHARPLLPLLEDRRRQKHVLVGGHIKCEAVKETNIQTELTPDESVLSNSESEFKEEEEEPFVDGSVLTGDGSELRSTVRLVECSMLAATAGLAYFLSNLLRLEVTYPYKDCQFQVSESTELSFMRCKVRCKSPKLKMLFLFKRSHRPCQF